MALAHAYLECTTGGSNKFYRMDEEPNGTFTVTYGPIGAMGTKATYPMSKWKQKYNEKIKKGYVDLTNGPTDSVDSTVSQIDEYNQKSEFIEILNSTRKFLLYNQSDNCGVQYEQDCYAIRAKKDFELINGIEITAGMYGGYVQSVENIPENEAAWVTENACVGGDAILCNGALVSENAKVFGNAVVKGVVKGDAVVCGEAYIGPESVICGDAIITGTAEVLACIGSGCHTDGIIENDIF